MLLRVPDVETASIRGDPEEFQRKFDALMEAWSQEEGSSQEL
jgi:hypothetical protein